MVGGGTLLYSTSSLIRDDSLDSLIFFIRS